MFRESIRLAVLGSVMGAVVMFAQSTPKKLSKNEAVAAVASRVQPEYSAIARQLKLEGAVELEAVVSEQGSVEDVRVVSGNPVLTKAAVEAVKKWKFTPAMESGKPVKELAPITVEFKRVDR